MIYAFIIGSYYNVVIAYTVFYFFASFTSTVPWTGCGHEWNTPFCSSLFSNCLDAEGIITLNNTCQKLSNLTESELKALNVSATADGDYDVSNYTDPFKNQRQSASEEYWRYLISSGGNTGDSILYATKSYSAVANHNARWVVSTRKCIIVQHVDTIQKRIKIGHCATDSWWRAFVDRPYCFTEQ